METNKPTESWNNPAKPKQENKKIIAGVLGILLGSLGIHKFVLGYNTEGIIMLAITVCTCGIGGAITGLISLIEGIIYLTKSDDEFYQTYQANKKGWF
jgi:TM2 domain-containing membrane protein YozV